MYGVITRISGNRGCRVNGGDLGLGAMTGGDFISDWGEGEGPSGMMWDIGTREGGLRVDVISGEVFVAGLEWVLELTLYEWVCCGFSLEGEGEV